MLQHIRLQLGDGMGDGKAGVEGSKELPGAYSHRPRWSFVIVLYEYNNRKCLPVLCSVW